LTARKAAVGAVNWTNIAAVKAVGAVQCTESVNTLK